jgi:large subunit ribosomal protein L3
MMKGILGKKLGMTQVFAVDGKRIPVTVVEAGPCVVLQKKTVETDGYNALQLGFGTKKTHRANMPAMGHFKKAGKGAFTYLREIRTEGTTEHSVGDEISCDAVFAPGDMVDVTGTSKGKGLSGGYQALEFFRRAQLSWIDVSSRSRLDWLQCVAVKGFQRQEDGRPDG